MSLPSTDPTGMLLQEFVLDPSSSPEQKVECLKLLRIVIKNLKDPIKAQDEKYCTLRLDNAKVQQKLVAYPHAMDYLQAIGFVTETDLLRIPQTAVNANKMQDCWIQINNALKIVQPTNNNNSITSQPQQPPIKTNLQPRLSEKQKARILMEQKQQEEKLKAKQERKRNVALLKQDKYVRENDVNWKSGASAACVKSGEGISTFRDKYGES